MSFSDEEIEGISGKNWLHFFEESFGALKPNVLNEVHPREPSPAVETPFPGVVDAARADGGLLPDPAQFHENIDPPDGQGMLEI